nr:hypothetical protein [Tanacetum cinerariifolium]
LQLQVQRVRTDNGTEFKNKTLAKFFDEVGITQQFSATRTPQQNGVMERKNRTLVEAARTMLTFAYLPLFLWAEAIATTCFTQNRCWKAQGKRGYWIVVGYSKESVAFRIYNKRTRKIHESVNVNFDEISEMASKQFSLEPSLSNLNETRKSSNPSGSQVSETLKKDLEDLFHNFYDEYFDASKIMKSSTMVRHVTNEEIKRAMFGIGDNKAPGPDGFTFVFFKKGWDVVGQDVCNAVRDFFVNGKLLKEINHMFLALIPKVTTPHKVNDFRLISCYNVIYKCISKILTNRLIEGVKDVAYDTVDWCFLDGILTWFGFHPNMVKWYHKYCEELSIINVCFADDLFLFARGDVESVKVIMDSLNEFKAVSGLVPSIPKSTAYFCNVLKHVKISILNIMPFSEGKLPVKYLGVPLISSRLLNRDCKILVERHIRCFLWCNGDFKRGKAKVAWEVITLPKHEGGLGIQNLEVFNLTLMTTHIWNIVSNKESLWVRWIHTYKIRDRTLWHIQPTSCMSWNWRNILKLRDRVKPFLWSQIGNGLSTSIWYDMWCSQSPISRFITPRDMAREGFSIRSKVVDLMRHGIRQWPLAWLMKAPNLNLVVASNFTNSSDRIQWRYANGMIADFFVKLAWEALRVRGDIVNWSNMVWFTHCIPRHAFHLWLVLRRRLKTQDMLRPWDVDPSTDLNALTCVFCKLQMDSYEHLFFECSFSAHVWQLVRIYAELEHIRPVLNDITSWFQNIASQRTIDCSKGQDVLRRILEIEESSSSSLNDDVQQSSEEVGVSSSNTQSVSNNMDAYFDASTSFHDPSNVHTFYQPYPHEKKWTKDHPLHRIIGDPKSSVRTRGQLANSCLFSCLLSFIEPANVAEALRDADWVSAMQEELNQFARLKVWRLVYRPEGKAIIKTK